MKQLISITKRMEYVRGDILEATNIIIHLTKHGTGKGGGRKKKEFNNEC